MVSKNSAMGVLAALTSALTTFNPKSVNVDNEKEMYQAVCKTMGNSSYCNMDDNRHIL
jgi:hypothetical protein